MYSVYLGHYDDVWGYPIHYEYGPRKLGRCLRPSSCAIVVDGKNKSLTAGGRCSFDICHLAGAQDYVDPRHSGDINVLFADGHVEWDNPLQKTDAQIQEVYRWGNFVYWPR